MVQMIAMNAKKPPCLPQSPASRSEKRPPSARPVYRDGGGLLDAILDYIPVAFTSRLSPSPVANPRIKL